MQLLKLRCSAQSLKTEAVLTDIVTGMADIVNVWALVYNERFSAHIRGLGHLQWCRKDAFCWGFLGICLRFGNTHAIMVGGYWAVLFAHSLSGGSFLVLAVWGCLFLQRENRQKINFSLLFALNGR